MTLSLARFGFMWSLESTIGLSELLLNGHHYTVWEGGRQYSAHSSYQDARLLKGYNYAKAKNFKEALKEYQAALEYPENFSEGRPVDGGKAPIIYYFMAAAYESLGDANMARTYFEKSATPPSKACRPSEAAYVHGPQILYYRGLAARKLGRPAEAADIFDSLIKSGQEALLASDSGRPDYFAKFGERETKEARMAQGHYVLALGYLGSGQRQEAKTELQQAVKLNVNHLDAQFQLSNIGDRLN